LRSGVQAGLARQENESETDYAARKKLIESQIESLTKGINELEQITLGLALDRKTKSGHVDLSLLAVSGSNSAKMMSQLQHSTTDFGGFLMNDAAASLNVTGKFTKDSTGQVASALQSLRTQAMERIDAEPRLAGDDASKKLAKEMVNDVLDAIG